MLSILVFRIFQPYAFYGPGFFGVRPNPQWVANIKEQRSQAAGDIDYPPSLQWARRRVWFSAQNMVEWGLGIPLGMLAFSWFPMGWLAHTQRGLAATCPVVVVGRLLFRLAILTVQPDYALPDAHLSHSGNLCWLGGGRALGFSKAQASSGYFRNKPFAVARIGLGRIVSILFGGAVLITTFMWALSFSQIYSRSITRVAASEWIYQNVPGPINLYIQGQNETYSQPLSIPYGTTIQPGLPYQMLFTANASGTLNEVYLAHILDTQALQPITLNVSLSASSNGTGPFLAAGIAVSTTITGNASQNGVQLNIDTPLPVEAGQTYYLTMAIASGEQALDACGPVDIIVQTPTEDVTQTMAGPDQCVFSLATPFVVALTPKQSGMLEGIVLSKLDDQTPDSVRKTMLLTIGPTGDNQVVTTASLTADFSQGAENGGEGYTMRLDRPVKLELDKNYRLSLALESNSGIVSVRGSAVANEGDWDDGLPLRVDGYDAFGGIYTRGLNFNMYTDDSSDKLEHFIAIYDQTEYILVSSNRQWGSLPRLPERFPMTTLHYRHLLGCPENQTIYWCYSVAKPGMFHGDLGFDLVEIFQSDPLKSDH